MKNKVNVNAANNNEMKKLIQISIIVILIFGIFYLITKVATDNTFEDEDIPREVEISFEEIILGDLLNQKDEEYFVLVTFEDDVYNSLYRSYLDEYYKEEREEGRYFANINNIFNKKYIGEESNFDINDLKFKESTLVKVKDGKLLETYEGPDAIKDYLKKIIDE